ncbi:MAG: YaeQ family protein [Nitrospiria bacterium]
MALTATIYKASLHIADMDRHYYRDHALTIARHPSETDERMMVRVLAFVRHAHEHLSFANGLSSEEEPDLWQKDLTGAIELWIEVGQPDDKHVRKVCGRAKQVVIYTYGRSADRWWEQGRAKLERMENLSVLSLPVNTTGALAKLAQRDMKLHCTLQDGEVSIGDGDETVQVDPATLKRATAPSR